jgi:hypothetical protein
MARIVVCNFHIVTNTDLFRNQRKAASLITYEQKGGCLDYKILGYAGSRQNAQEEFCILDLIFYGHVGLFDPLSKEDHCQKPACSLCVGLISQPLCSGFIKHD